jgi:predicted dehydrogenase
MTSNRSVYKLVHNSQRGLNASSFDQYSPARRGTWKDELLPGNGMVFGFGSHLIDQALQLFGRPEKLTAFVSSVRGIGVDLDDAVSSFRSKFEFLIEFTCHIQLTVHYSPALSVAQTSSIIGYPLWSQADGQKSSGTLHSPRIEGYIFQVRHGCSRRPIE